VEGREAILDTASDSENVARKLPIALEEVSRFALLASVREIR